MHKDNKTTKDPFQSRISKVLEGAKSNVFRQAALAIVTILLALVLIFAMSAAWYTNVVKTGDLVFQVEQWGFSGSVDISDVPILAAPGDSGVIQLSMTNSSNDLVAASVSILKNTMSADMQKRLYFYADASDVINEESVERVYLNSQQNYTYDIFSQGVLTLSDTVYNDVQLKWCWVYDVLGYYVQGTLDKNTNKVQATEYLRPVEYTYDESKTTFDANGKLLTIDGTKTAGEFLAELSAKDGYPGTITVDEGKWTADGYYPVSVDAKGTGVYVKLLTYSEIEKEIITDTAMGTGQSVVEAIARLTITAENILLKTTEVANAEQLAQQLQTEGTVVLQLTNDVAVEQLTIGADTRAIVDLNGHTITSTTDTNIITVEEGGSLTMMDGAMTGNGGNAITSVGAEITLSNMTISGYKKALDIRDNTVNTDSAVRVVGSNINTSSPSFYILGNGAASATATKLIIEDTTVISDYAAVCGNGNDDSWGTDVQIIGSNLTGQWTAIYNPQRDSIVTVSSGSNLSGYTGIAMKGGELYVMDSTVTGTGAYAAPGFAVSGWTDTGDGIYIETNYNHDVLVEISGNSTVTGTQANTKAIQVHESNAPQVTVRVFAGTFSTSVADYLADGSTQTSQNNTFVVTGE